MFTVLAALASLSFSIPAPVLAGLVGLVIPAAVDLFTKVDAPAWLKTTANLLLASVAGWLATAVADTRYNVWTVAGAILSAFVVSATAYYNLHRPFGISRTIRRRTGGFGVG